MADRRRADPRGAGAPWRGETLFHTRQYLARFATAADYAARASLVAAPVLTVLTRVPQLGLICLLLAVGSVVLGTLVHLVTLPVEFDASFRKALPMLTAGHYLHNPDLPHARRILTAAALTYAAGSLGSLLNPARLARWHPGSRCCGAERGDAAARARQFSGPCGTVRIVVRAGHA